MISKEPKNDFRGNDFLNICCNFWRFDLLLGKKTFTTEIMISRNGWKSFFSRKCSTTSEIITCFWAFYSFQKIKSPFFWVFLAREVRFKNVSQLVFVSQKNRKFTKCFDICVVGHWSCCVRKPWSRGTF